MATCEHIPTITPYCWLSLAISQKIILNSLSGSKCGKSPRADYAPSVNVKTVKQFAEGQLDKAICETLKYSVKPDDLTLTRDSGAWLHEMTRQTFKMRFIATGGVLKGCFKSLMTRSPQMRC